MLVLHKHARELQHTFRRLLMLTLTVQMVVSANGHHKVPFVDLIVEGKVGWRVSARLRVASF